jgi:hypothetical protein
MIPTSATTVNKDGTVPGQNADVMSNVLAGRNVQLPKDVKDSCALAAS